MAQEGNISMISTTSCTPGDALPRFIDDGWDLLSAAAHSDCWDLVSEPSCLSNAEGFESLEFSYKDALLYQGKNASHAPNKDKEQTKENKFMKIKDTAEHHYCAKVNEQYGSNCPSFDAFSIMNGYKGARGGKSTCLFKNYKRTSKGDPWRCLDTHNYSTRLSPSRYNRDYRRRSRHNRKKGQGNWEM